VVTSELGLLLGDGLSAVDPGSSDAQPVSANRKAAMVRITRAMHHRMHPGAARYTGFCLISPGLSYDEPVEALIEFILERTTNVDDLVIVEELRRADPDLRKGLELMLRLRAMEYADDAAYDPAWAL